jgi:hypothetical protein
MVSPSIPAGAAAADSRKRPLGDAPHWKREHFIPVRRDALLALLESQTELSVEERSQLRALYKMLEATFHHHFQEHLSKLKQAYAPFNPDDDTRSLERWADDARQRLKDQFFQDCQLLLSRANYQRLSQSEIEEAVGATSDWGLRLQVDLSMFQRLEVYARGDVVGRRKRRTWQRMFREEEVDVPIFQRLVVVFSLNANCPLDKNVDASAVYMKLFKNIPKMDVDMLLPGTRVCMTLLDRSKIFLPTATGTTLTIVKIVNGALLAALSGVWGMIVLLGCVIGLIGYGVRSFLGYLSTKDRYQLSLTRNLYYQNLDNNAGVFFRLLDEAEDQEMRESLLAYYLLWKRAPAEGWTESELDRAVESFLYEAIKVDVDFESHDAVEKLCRYGLAQCGADQRLQAVAPRTALSKLDAGWDRFFSF